MRSYVIEIPYSELRDRLLPSGLSPAAQSAATTSIVKRVTYYSNNHNSAFHTMFEPFGDKTRMSLPDGVEEYTARKVALDYISRSLGRPVVAVKG